MKSQHTIRPCHEMTWSHNVPFTKHIMSQYVPPKWAFRRGAVLQCPSWNDPVTQCPCHKTYFVTIRSNQVGISMRSGPSVSFMKWPGHTTSPSQNISCHSTFHPSGHIEAEQCFSVLTLFIHLCGNFCDVGRFMTWDISWCEMFPGVGRIVRGMFHTWHGTYCYICKKDASGWGRFANGSFCINSISTFRTISTRVPFPLSTK